MTQQHMTRGVFMNQRLACLMMCIFILVPIHLYCQTSATPIPHLTFADLESGPATGGKDSKGTIVTLYGSNFGSSQSTSTVTIGGVAVAAYIIWSDTKIGVQIGNSAVSGSFVVKTAAGTSNGLPFAVRSGNIYFVATTGSDTNTGSYAAPFKTIPHAAAKLSPGDIAYVMDGVAQTALDNYNASLSIA